MNVSFEYARIGRVESFEELVRTPFTEGVNALCWEREIAGDYSEVVRLLGGGEGVVGVDEEMLLALPVSEAGQVAVDRLVEDLRLLREQGLAPELNIIHGYPRDEEPDGVRTDVFSFHADRAPVEADTYLCTYHGPASEGLRNEEGRKHVEVPETRAELLKLYGGEEGPEFEEFLSDNCYDLHYAPAEGARPYGFGLGHVWRIAVEYPGCPVPPCIHRAPETAEGDGARLLMIS
ncbi:hypothetical protein WJU23_15960 [Prosthecobacter sp. SYSU 5D2]|uniref:hypothetical protein n=1 Tax=Prosthecobacter sp. SYSU 5D2 TaxID=3134134 RepID=UPI0031FE63AA